MRSSQELSSICFIIILFNECVIKIREKKTFINNLYYVMVEMLHIDDPYSIYIVINTQFLMRK